MRKKYWIPLVVLFILLVTYFLGPVSEKPVFDKTWPEVPSALHELEDWIKAKENRLPVREDNQARIVWAKGKLKKTEYAFVYLHGFAGSYRDGFPVNVQTADTFGANIYLSRWAGHGLKPPASLNEFTAEEAWQDAKEALAIGRQIGDKVILMSTSTGGTLSIMLAAEFPDSVHAMINMSPNIQDDQTGSFLLNSPWGWEIAHLISLGNSRKINHKTARARHYWDTIYPARALIELQILVESAMTENTFGQVTSPTLTLCYHKNFWKEDERVEVDAIRKAHEQFNTPEPLKTLVCLEEPGTHFIGSHIKSKNINVVQEQIMDFCLNTLNITLPKKTAQNQN